MNQYTAEDLLGPLNDLEKRKAPKQLFVEGDPKLLRGRIRVAIVGSRKASPEGRRRADKLARLLVQRGIVVVSGLAEGIDTAAHESAIRNGGKTVAVIGTPLSQAYPRSNAALQKKIAVEHAVISQFAEGQPVQRKNFPMRNAVMALISSATVIVEAGDTSGSLSQGWEALRLGRSLFMMESLIQNESLTWPKEMLNYGAQVLSDRNLTAFLDTLPSEAAEYECAF